MYIDIYIYKTVLSLCVPYQFWSFQYTQKNSYLYSVFYNLRHIWTHRENFSFEKHILVLFTLRLYCLFVPLLSTFYHFGSFIARLFTPRGNVRILNITITWKWSTYSKKQKYFCLQKYWIELSRAIDMQLYLAIIYDNHFFLPYYIYKLYF